MQSCYLNLGRKEISVSRCFPSNLTEFDLFWKELATFQFLFAKLHRMYATFFLFKEKNINIFVIFFSIHSYAFCLDGHIKYQ